MRGALLLVVSVVCGCAHQPVSSAALDSLERLAFIARIEEGSPRSVVFRDDAASYRERLKSLDAREADRRLGLKLDKGTDSERSLSRHQVSDVLRVSVLGLLPKEAPWTRVAPQAQVATLLESFLVDEVPANAPDLTRLQPLGIDSVLEIVVEDYGLRSVGGKAGIYLLGTARLYRVNGGTLYRRAFISDELKAGLPPLDPFEVAKRPSVYADRLKSMLETIASQIARDLTPADRVAHAAPAKPDVPAPARPAEDDPL